MTELHGTGPGVLTQTPAVQDQASHLMVGLPPSVCGVFVQFKEGVSSLLLHNKLPETEQLQTTHTDGLTVPVGRDTRRGQLGPPLQALT